MNILYKCPKCGSMSDYGKFCRYCGAKLNERVLTFENTNTLLRSNVVINDDTTIAEDDALDKNDKSSNFEDSDKLQDNSTNNNIYSFSNNGNDAHNDRCDENNDFHPESTVEEKNENDFSKPTLSENHIKENIVIQNELDSQEYEKLDFTEKTEKLNTDTDKEEVTSELVEKTEDVSSFCETNENTVVSNKAEPFDSMFGELPTFDTELIKRNYEQSIVNKNKSDNKRNKFFSKKKTE